MRGANSMNNRKKAASQYRLGVENAVLNNRYLNGPQTAAQNDVGTKIEQREKLLSMVKQSPYSNAMSHANLAVAGGIVLGGDPAYSPNNKNRDLNPSMSVDKKLQ